MPIPPHIQKKLDADRAKLEIEIEQYQWDAARELAEDIIEEMGWKKDDEDYEYQLKEETERLYEEERERDYFKRRYRYDPEFMKILEEEEREEENNSSKDHEKI